MINNTNEKTHKENLCKCDNTNIFSDEIYEFIYACKNMDNHESYLIEILHKVQNTYGYLTKEAMIEISNILEIPAAKISGVATFYHYFKLIPQGKYIISICTGTACYVKGAESLVKKLKEILKIESGETTKDGLFTLEETRCLGTCALAPIIKIGEEIFSKVKPGEIESILKKYK